MRAKTHKHISHVAVKGSILWFEQKQQNYLVLRFDHTGDAVLIKCDATGKHAPDAAPFRCGWLFNRLMDRVV